MPSRAPCVLSSQGRELVSQARTGHHIDRLARRAELSLHKQGSGQWIEDALIGPTRGLWTARREVR